MRKIVGYISIHAEHPHFHFQSLAIQKYAVNCHLDYLIFAETSSKFKIPNQELQKALENTQPNDIFVIYKLDCLASTTKELYEIIKKLEEKNVDFVSIYDDLDTSLSSGKSLFKILSAIMEFQQSIISQRTKIGLEAARKKGNKGGRPSIDINIKKQVYIRFKEGQSVKYIAESFNIATSTVYKILKEKSQ